MKRIFALALVLAMMLSMMVMTASADGPCSHNFLPHNCTRHTIHIYVRDMNGPYDVDTCISQRNYVDTDTQFTNFEDNFHIAPYFGLLIGSNDGFIYEVCTPVAQPKTQPKTGVMDTLPVWFGVMAVSACAYILTSKKKVF